MTEGSGTVSPQAPHETAPKSRSGTISLRSLAAGLGSRIWHFLASLQLAIVLILVLACLSLIGALVIQAPADVASSPADYQVWLASVRQRFGMWTRVIDALYLFDVFHSPWFRASLSLLALNIIACSISRWKNVRHMISTPPVQHPEAFYFRTSGASSLSGLVSGPSAAASALAAALKGRRYRTVSEEAKDKVYVYADKNRFSRLGFYLVHLSLLLLLAGAIGGGLLGFQNTSFMVPEGSLRQVGYGTDLSLKLVSFADEYYPSGPPKDYRSQIVLYKDGQEVRQAVVRVNRPLSYGGVTFYQSFFGQAAIIRVADEAGNVLFNDGVALGYVLGEKPMQRSAGAFSIPQKSMVVYVVAPAGIRFADPLIPAGEMRIEVYRHGEASPFLTRNLMQGKPETAQGLTFTFERERQYSGFSVAKDPALPLVWTACVLLVLGLVATFYFPHRRVWALCAKGMDGRTEVHLRGGGRRDHLDEEEAAKIMKETEKAVNMSGTGG